MTSLFLQREQSHDQACHPFRRLTVAGLRLPHNRRHPWCSDQQPGGNQDGSRSPSSPRPASKSFNSLCKGEDFKRRASSRNVSESIHASSNSRHRQAPARRDESGPLPSRPTAPECAATRRSSRSGPRQLPNLRSVETGRLRAPWDTQDGTSALRRHSRVTTRQARASSLPPRDRRPAPRRAPPQHRFHESLRQFHRGRQSVSQARLNLEAWRAVSSAGRSSRGQGIPLQTAQGPSAPFRISLAKCGDDVVLQHHIVPVRE